MVLSCVNLTLGQAASLQVHTVCPVKVKVPHVSCTHLDHLFDKWKALLNTCSSFEKLLDLIEPHQWKSALWTEIVLATMEAEYIALSVVMWKLIKLQTLLFSASRTLSD